MSEQPGPVAFVSLRSTTATGPYNGEKTLNLNCPAKADHLILAACVKAIKMGLI